MEESEGKGIDPAPIEQLVRYKMGELLAVAESLHEKESVPA
jgi:hypothetical protein